MIKKTFKIKTVLLLSAVSVFSAVHGGFMLTADAAESRAVSALSELTEDEYARLYDNKIKWDEITNLIKYRNPTYRTYSGQADETIGIMKNAAADSVAELKDQLDSVDDSVDSIKEAQKELLKNGMSTSDTAYKKLEESLSQSNAARKMLKNGLSQMGSVTRNLNYGSKNTEIRLAPLRNQLISVVEGLIISYKTLEVNREMAAEQVTLYETLYDTYRAMEAENLAVSSDTAGYKASLDSARTSLSTLDSAMSQLKGNILLQCGYSADDNVEIAELPKADRNYLSGRDKAADKKTVIDANSKVLSAGKVSAYSGDVFKYRDANTNAAEAEAAANYDSICGNLEKQLILCDSSDTALKKAELMQNSLETKQSLGMLGKGEYEGLKLQYIVSKAAVSTNELNLLQATENYKFALLGIS